MATTNGNGDVPNPAEFIGDMRDAYLVCRDLGHAWKAHSFDKAEDARGEYVRILRCRQCRTRRHDRVDTWGVVVRRHYEHPDGYVFNGGGLYGLSRSDFRREVMRRAGLSQVRREDWKARRVAQEVD